MYCSVMCSAPLLLVVAGFMLQTWHVVAVRLISVSMLTHDTDSLFTSGGYSCHRDALSLLASVTASCNSQQQLLYQTPGNLS